jgi:2-polyprenyl-3-methyl-5-hydroxy-6-metoxy-1,4-benzoquinol methylase
MLVLSMSANEAGHTEGLAANRAWWDEVTPLHAASDFYDLDAFRQGRNDIKPFELDEVGPVSGRDLLHLQCHIGTDTLSWARHGARVVGLDFSAKSVEVAAQLATDCHLEAEFVRADVYDALEALGNRQFDIVYTGKGALGWLPDLDHWAEVVARLLRPGAILYLVEIHPVVQGVTGDGRTFTQDILGDRFQGWEGQGTYTDPTAITVNTVVFERNHALGELISAVINAGLSIEMFHEQSYTIAPAPWLVRGDDGFFRLPEGWPRYPLTYSLRARRGWRPRQQGQRGPNHRGSA